MLKMELLDCAINEKHCSVDGGRGICPLSFVPIPGDLTAQNPPPPPPIARNLPSKAKKKNANDRGSTDFKIMKL